MKFLIALALIAATASQAQSKKPPPPKWSQEPFEVTTTNVGGNFKGNDCNKIAAAAKKTKIVKDEFETAAAFEERVRQQSGKPLYGALNFDSNLAFNADALLSQYDPENQLLEVTAPVVNQKQNVGGESVNWDTVEINSYKESNYIGTNAYGVKTNVHRTDVNVCGVILLWDRSNRHLIRFPLRQVSPEMARELKNNVTVLYVGKLAPPFVQAIRHHSTPTLSAPSEKTYTGDGVVLHLNAMWLVNTRTGEVIEKQKY